MELFGEINWTKDWEETRKLIKSEDIIVLDVRPSDEINEELKEFSSIIHICQQDLKLNMSKLPKQKIILVFCRGRMCALSAYSVNILRENGYSAYRLEESWTRLKKELVK
jgi:rhodanese-related sulfurtransferase